MTANKTPPQDGAQPVRRRTFLAGTLGAAGTVLVAGCEAASQPGASPNLSTQHPSALQPNALDASASPSLVGRINHRPNDGSGLWADFSNTGYLHDPGYNPSAGNCTHGYPGLTDYEAGMTANRLLYVNKPVGHVFNQIHFRGTAMLGHNTGDKWTFNGCVFDNGGKGKGAAGFIFQNYLPTECTWKYCTFKPCDFAMPPGNDGTVTTSHTYPGTPYLSSYQTFDTNSNGRQTGMAVVKRHHCDIWGNAGMQDIFSGTPHNHVVLDWCYIHDQADTDWSTGRAAGVPADDLYHHDGVGPNDIAQWLNITNCTIASLGNTNAIAFQGTPCRHNVVTGNYLSGFGATVNLGGTGMGTDTHTTFTDNVFSCEVPYIFRPQYWGSAWHSVSKRMVWRRNRFQFFAGDPKTTAHYPGGPKPSPNGKGTWWQGRYWWPTDLGATPHRRDYGG